jgi:hypothetical protein
MTSEAELEDLLQWVDALPMPDLCCVPRMVSEVMRHQEKGKKGILLVG